MALTMNNSLIAESRRLMSTTALTSLIVFSAAASSMLLVAAGPALAQQVIDGEETGPIVIEDGETLTVDGGAVSGAVNGGANGVINAKGGSVDIVNGSTVTNTPTANGNAVVASGTATVTISDSILTSNGTGANGSQYSSAVAAGGETTVEIEDSTLAVTGERGYALRVAGKSTVTATNVDITTAGGFSYGVQVFGIYEGDDASASLIGGSITASSTGYSPGVQVSGTGAFLSASDGLEITTAGSQSAGVTVDRGGVAELADISIETTGEGARGLRAYRWDGDADSRIDAERVTINTKGDHASGVYADTEGVSGSVRGGAVINLTDVDIATEGLWAHGAHAMGADDGNTNLISIVGGSITTENDKGRFTQDGDGSRAYALYAQGKGAEIEATGTDIRTYGQRAYGAYATGGATITLEDVAIETDGFMAYGVYASGAGSVVEATNVDITTNGQVGDAAWAYDGGRLEIDGGTYHIKGEKNPNAGELANGLVAVGGTAGVNDGVIVAKNLTIITEGAESRGMRAGASIGSAKTSGQIELSDSKVTVKGVNALVADVSYGSSLDVRNSTLVSQQGAGILLKDNATVTLVGTTMQSSAESFRSEFTQAGQVQTVTVGDGSVITTNNGTLLLVDRSEDGGDGEMNLVLEAGSTTSGDILDEGQKTTGGGTDVWLEEGASWTGAMRGVRNFFGASGGSAVFEGDADIAGELNAGGTGTGYTFNGNANIGGGVKGEDNNNFTFNGSATINGGMSGSNSTSFQFDGETKITGDVSGSSGTSFQFSQSAPTVITGNVSLSGNSSTSGGSVTTPVAVVGNVAVDSSSTFGGNFEITGDVKNSGATGPGNSIGVHSIHGNLNWNSTHTYQVEVDSSGNADRVNVFGDGIHDGIATIGGSVVVSPYPAGERVRLQHGYTILSAADIQGEFASARMADDLLPYIDPVLSAGTAGGNETVVLTLTGNEARLLKDTRTANQRAVSVTLGAIQGSNDAAAGAFLQANALEARDVLDQLSGTIHASAGGLLTEQSSLLRNVMLERVYIGGDSLLYVDTPLMSYAPADGAPAGGQAGRSMWASTFGSWGRADDDGNAGRRDHTTRGVVFGIDGQVHDAWWLGFLGGYSATSFEVTRENASGRSDNFHVGAYGGATFDQLSLRLGAAYTHHAVDIDRSVSAPFLSDDLSSEYGAGTAQLFGEAGYRIDTAGAALEPFANMALVHHAGGSYAESGGDAALSGRTGSMQMGFGTLGMRVSTEHSMGDDTTLRLNGILGWRHAFGDLSPQAVHALEGGAPFSVAGTAIARNTFVFEAGARLNVTRDADIGLSYSGQVAQDRNAHAIEAVFSLRF